MMDKVAVGKIVFQAFQFPQMRKIFGLKKGDRDNKNRGCTMYCAVKSRS
jgi:hypothetical protein